MKFKLNEKQYVTWSYLFCNGHQEFYINFIFLYCQPNQVDAKLYLLYDFGGPNQINTIFILHLENE